MPLPSGASFLDIDLTQLDKKSPVDDTLMDSIGEDLYYLKNQVAAVGGGGVFEFKVNGALSAIKSLLPFRRIDGAFVSTGQTLNSNAMFLEIAGTSGILECDIRKYRRTNTPIIGIDYQYSQSINSITRAGASGTTQSIAKATPQVATQSISYWKATLNIQSIIYLGAGLWRYNLDAALDSDFIKDDYIKFESCTSGANNGVFKIVRLRDDGLNNVVISNSSGVAQISAAGTAKLQAFKYVLVNPADSNFVANEKAVFASHTSAVNDGTLTIYAVNQGGNNIIVKNQNGIEQGGVAGTIDVLRYQYTLGTTVSSDIVVGETAYFSGHTSAVNDGNLPIRSISGTQLIVYNLNGAIQGGVAGTVDSNRWIYALPTDPTSSFSVGQSFKSENTTSLNNQGTFAVKQINRSASNNLVTFNEIGVTQGGAVGTLLHTRRIVKFSADQSAIYATNSKIALSGCPDGNYNQSEFDIVEVNRGGGANYNVVIDLGKALNQLSPAGQVTIESRSVFSARPSITFDEHTKNLQTSSNGVLDTTEKVIASGRMLCLEILQIPSGSPENLTVHVK